METATEWLEDVNARRDTLTLTVGRMQSCRLLGWMLAEATKARKKSNKQTLSVQLGGHTLRISAGKRSTV